MINVTWIDSFRLRARAGGIRDGWAASTRPGVAFHELPEATLRSRTGGTRKAGEPTVVMVCDPPNVLEHFDAVFERFSPHGRVIVFEPPGFGFSLPSASFRFTFDEYRACIEGLLRKLDEGPYVLAFTCVWAHIALQVAAKEPGMIAKLMLWQSPSWAQQVTWAREVDKKKVISRPVLGQVMTALKPEKIGLGWYRAALAKNRYPDFMPTLEQALKRGAFCCLGSLWQQWFHGYTPPPVRVEQPALVTWGLADRTHARSDKESIGSQLAHAKWHSFQHAGHSPELEASQEYCELLRGWLQED
ncbi:alpha/beta fold hydrolase [Cystobacter ferrugineus]|uniref:Alpha/beta hydrolase n=1 Tax=Cystobacter ferrugineus TaxID=83449 RepID=A0A1L9BK18_9BACT|nr:alpha/beta hydrolase [Cystobacter ferrugineus]OJH42518.1 alpha/beta hydrolase [Cystobacter ferrugineus]